MTLRTKILFVAALCIAGINLFIFKDRIIPDRRPLITVVQSYDHASLSAVRHGFMHEIENRYPHEFKIVSIINTHDTRALKHAVKKHMRTSTSAAFVCIGTPAAQIVAHSEKHRPILCAAINDPERAGITNNHNVAGISDAFDLKQLVECAHKALPNATKIGIIINPESPTYQSDHSALAEGCTEYHLESVWISASTAPELMQELTSRAHTCDIWIAPADNLIASYIVPIAEFFKQAQLPLLVGDKTLVAYGPVAGFGMDYAALGRFIARQFDAIWSCQKTVSEIGIIHTAPQCGLNRESLALLSERQNFNTEYLLMLDR